MSKRFGMNDDTIYCVNDDGSVTNIAIIDVEDGDVRPIDNEKWYSEIEDELEELSGIKENYAKLLNIISGTNKQIASSKSKVSSLDRAYERSIFKKVSNKKNAWTIIFVCIILFLIAFAVTILGDFNYSSCILAHTHLAKIALLILSGLTAICVVGFLLIFHNGYHLLNLMQEAKIDSENLSVIHCNDIEVYDFANQLNLASIPMIISDVLIGNTDYNGNIQTAYGNRISQTDTMYLKPKVKYFGIKSGVQTLRIRWIKPDGSISKGNSSIGDFSQISGYNISSGKNDEIVLSGWGGKDKGHWPAGQYFIEIWHDEIRLIRNPFTIY